MGKVKCEHCKGTGLVDLPKPITYSKFCPLDCRYLDDANGFCLRLTADLIYKDNWPLKDVDCTIQDEDDVMLN